MKEMAFRSLKLFRTVRSASLIRHNINFSFTAIRVEEKQSKSKDFKTENKLVYLEDPDTFGTLSGRTQQDYETDDEGDFKENQYLEELPLKSQKLTIKQYADLIKQFIENKRLKEAMDVLEVRMLTQDRVKPSNYIYNILIGACAEVGYTKKAFKLFNDMKRRGLKPTGDTYTCLFQACTNSPWTIDGLKNAKHLRELMLDKSIEPNLTNYNAMIKAFGRCGDLPTAFQIVDEMVAKKIKIRVHTFNHLLHACITDKDSGLRHALIVWRKMLKMREKPNIYSFNLMLKCVKECNLGTRHDIEDLISIIYEHTPVVIDNNEARVFQIESRENEFVCLENSNLKLENLNNIEKHCQHSRHSHKNELKINPTKHSLQNGTDKENATEIIKSNDLKINTNDHFKLELVDKSSLKVKDKTEERTVPNLLSKAINMQKVLALQEVKTAQDKFTIVGGQEDFLKEMKAYSVKPDVKIFTQMLPLIEDTREAENQLIEDLTENEVKVDIDFYNLLIKKRCLRSDYDGALEIKKMIKDEGEFRKKRYPLNKKLRLRMNVMTYGVLAMTCKTKKDAEELLNEINEKKLRVNIEILGALLRQGTAHNSFDYVLYIMDIVKKDNVKLNEIFIKHLESFNDKCASIIGQKRTGQLPSEDFLKSYKKFSKIYTNWLKEVNAEEALITDHPWKQFRENYPETFQRQNIEIVEPKRFYKRDRKYVPYAPK